MGLIARSAIALAVCTALGSAAHAFPRTSYPAATKVYFGGATATDNVLQAAFLSAPAGTGICDPVIGNIDIYNAANQRVITCFVTNETTPGNGFPTRAQGGLAIAFHKESAGGSSNGVNPLLAVSAGQAHTLRWLDVAQLTDDCTVTVVPGTANSIGYTNHASCPSVLTPVDTAGSAVFDVHGGISDLEPALSFPAPTPAEIARLAVSPGIGIVFGVPVTTALYRALQVSQFGDGSACDGADTEACVPSLTRPQIRALYTQTVFDWNDFRNNAGVPLTAVPGVTAPADEFVRICRRVATSGTQASFEVYFLNQRCVDGVPGFAGPDDASTITDTTYSPNDFLNGSLVNAAPSSGNVAACLASANTNNFWGLGILSTEVNDATYNAGNIRFIGIDGAAPNLANTANGDYDFFVENTINRINTGAGVLPAGDPRRAVVQIITQRLGNTAALASLNTGFDGRPWGNGGVLSLASATTANTAPYSAAELVASPVNTQTRGGNNCVPAYTVRPQPVNGTPNP